MQILKQAKIINELNVGNKLLAAVQVANNVFDPGWKCGNVFEIFNIATADQHFSLSLLLSCVLPATGWYMLHADVQQS